MILVYFGSSSSYISRIHEAHVLQFKSVYTQNNTCIPYSTKLQNKTQNFPTLITTTRPPRSTQGHAHDVNNSEPRDARINRLKIDQSITVMK